MICTWSWDQFNKQYHSFTPLYYWTCNLHVTLLNIFSSPYKCKMISFGLVMFKVSLFSVHSILIFLCNSKCQNTVPVGCLIMTHQHFFLKRQTLSTLEEAIWTQFKDYSTTTPKTKKTTKGRLALWWHSFTVLWKWENIVQ